MKKPSKGVPAQEKAMSAKDPADVVAYNNATDRILELAEAKNATETYPLIPLANVYDLVAMEDATDYIKTLPMGHLPEDPIQSEHPTLHAYMNAFVVPLYTAEWRGLPRNFKQLIRASDDDQIISKYVRGHGQAYSLTFPTVRKGKGIKNPSYDAESSTQFGDFSFQETPVQLYSPEYMPSSSPKLPSLKSDSSQVIFPSHATATESFLPDVSFGEQSSFFLTLDDQLNEAFDEVKGLSTGSSEEIGSEEEEPKTEAIYEEESDEEESDEEESDGEDQDHPSSSLIEGVRRGDETTGLVTQPVEEDTKGDVSVPYHRSPAVSISLHPSSPIKSHSARQVAGARTSHRSAGSSSEANAQNSSYLSLPSQHLPSPLAPPVIAPPKATLPSRSSQAGQLTASSQSPSAASPVIPTRIYGEERLGVRDVREWDVRIWDANGLRLGK
jgi:hypothetical protein